MARHIKNEVSLNDESKKNVTIGANLFGFVRNINTKLIRSNSALPIMAETARECAVKAELEKAKAVYCTLKRTSTN